VPFQHRLCETSSLEDILTCPLALLAAFLRCFFSFPLEVADALSFCSSFSFWSHSSSSFSALSASFSAGGKGTSEKGRGGGVAELLLHQT